MARVATLLTVVVVCLLFAAVLSAQTYTASLDGAQVVSPSGSTATGFGTLTLDAGKMLSFNITFMGLLGTETMSHIHGPGAVGVNAGVQYALPLGTPKNGSVGPLSPAQEADLNNGLWYIQVHSTRNAGGEIRGQIYLQVVPTENTTWGAIKALYEK